MKRLILPILVFFALLSSCADSKTFEKSDGTKFTAEPYGWGNYQTKKVEGVNYEVCVGNVVWSVLAIETAIVPIWLTGWELYELVSYLEPVK